jgi:hypothetical protein
MTDRAPDEGLAWIDQMTDSQCMEVFWLYVDPPEPFLAKYPPALLGAAMRRALREVARADRLRHASLHDGSSRS